MSVRFSLRFYVLLTTAVLLLTIAGGAFYIAFSGDESARRLRAKIVGLIADPPKKVAENLMAAAQAGDGEKFFQLVSRNAHDRFLNKCALTGSDRPVREIADAYMADLKKRLDGALFEFETPKNDLVNEDLVIVPVRILFEKQPAQFLELRIIREPDGHWKCDNRL